MRGIPGMLWIGALAGIGVASSLAKVPDALTVDGTRIEIEADRLPRERSVSPWADWLSTNLRAAATVTDGFPRREVRVQLVPTRRTQGAIAFGQVRRSQPPGIRFYVNADASLNALLADWRGYHEFAHLLIPFPGNDDIWFTEGLASYYQYLLQSRAGVIAAEQAWRELLEGFERGLNDRRGRGRSLHSLSPDMWEERAQKRVYWTGAAFFLRVDTRLRTESGGRHSLDKALARFNACCIDRQRRWDAAELIEELGRLSIPSVWREEYLATIHARAEPRFADALQRLGIEYRGNPDRLRFDRDPARQALRDAIAGRRFDADALVRAGGRSNQSSSTSP